VELNFFTKFICDPAYLESGSLGLNPLVHQSTNKKVTQVFFVKLVFVFGSCYVIFFSLHI